MKNGLIKELRNFSRRVAQEGVILLENKNSILPIVNKKVAVFGRIQTDYYKSGTGSGGLVNVTDVPSIIDAIKENPRLEINEELLTVYLDWIKDNPFNAGNGMWASEPWTQEEMLISKEEIMKIKKEDEVPIVIIGRTAGEDRDNANSEGSYLLTNKEYELIKTVKDVYGKVVVLLNVGNLINLDFVKKLDVDVLMYIWHGGQDGARAAIDVVTGYVTPSGKLPATSFKDLDLYPANKDFGNKKELIYEEDIYVGYRFFETFYPEQVLYPFGYGLSYTTFDLSLVSNKVLDNKIELVVRVTNKGSLSGKEVVQVYYEAPQGLLGKPKVQLIAFSKTKLLKPLEHQDVKLVFAIEKMGSYDDFGYISKSSYVLEAGDYTIYYGNSARSISKALVYKNKENIVTERLEEALAPVKKFKRIKPKFKGGKYVLSYENVPLRTVDLANRITSNLPEQLPLNNEKIVFDDVKAGKVSLDQFIGSLSVIELSDLLIAEGMSSPKVTPGTAGAIGGTTDELQSKKVDILCCSDGPSGIRMDSGGLATSLPNGTLLASTFNPDIIERLYQFLGMEMNNYNVNIILGPGMNIQRHPLNGRNFEYFSEDPLLTGMMASAAIRGLNKVGVDGSLKHFAANNQETARTMANSIISERALREIYLKGFEIAVKESKAAIVMTAYNPINGIWTASNYDLTTTILRKEWGFDGVVMTDWWAQMNIDNDEPSKENTMAMVRAQNDLYMVVPNVREHKHNLVTEYQKGNITLGEIQRTAKNVLKLIIKMSNRSGKDFNNQINKWFETNSIFSMEEYFNDGVAKKFITDYEELANETIIKHFNFFDKKDQVVYGVVEKDSQVLYTFGVKPLVIKNEFDEIFKEITSHNLYTFKKENWGLVTLDLNGYVYKNKQANDEWDNVPKDAIYVYEVDCLEDARYIIEIELSSKLPNENQMPFSIYVDNINEQTLTTNGTNDEKITVRSYIVINKGKHYLSFKFHKTGITVHNIKVIKHG